jgi:hypothetical protein
MRVRYQSLLLQMGRNGDGSEPAFTGSLSCPSYNCVAWLLSTASRCANIRPEHIVLKPGFPKNVVYHFLPYVFRISLQYAEELQIITT